MLRARLELVTNVPSVVLVEVWWAVLGADTDGSVGRILESKSTALLRPISRPCNVGKPQTLLSLGPGTEAFEMFDSYGKVAARWK
jgi:hypothetical protein